jgi:hypothetical protein
MAKSSKFDIAGITASYQRTYHLQTYALYLRKPTPDVLAPILGMKIYRYKRNVVRHGELAFSKEWIRRGFRVGAVWNFEIENLESKVSNLLSERDLFTIRKLLANEVVLNPSIHFWPWLFRDMQIIKKSLMLKNPAKFEFVPKSVHDLSKKLH